MKFLGFYPETVAARVQAAAVPPRVPTLARSLGVGAGGFCLIAVAVFSIIAGTDAWLRRHWGELASYAVYSSLFVLLAPSLFRRLLIPPG